MVVLESACPLSQCRSMSHLHHWRKSWRGRAGAWGWVVAGGWVTPPLRQHDAGSVALPALPAAHDACIFIPLGLLECTFAFGCRALCCCAERVD